VEEIFRTPAEYARVEAEAGGRVGLILPAKRWCGLMSSMMTSLAYPTGTKVTQGLLQKLDK
jgi:hypothetical protein